MLFLFGITFMSVGICVTGFLMFAFPAKYAQIVNWYFAKVGSFGRPLLFKKYARWPYRVSGLMLFLMSFLAFYEVFLQFKIYLR